MGRGTFTSLLFLREVGLEERLSSGRWPLASRQLMNSRTYVRGSASNPGRCSMGMSSLVAAREYQPRCVLPSASVSAWLSPFITKPLRNVTSSEKLCKFLRTLRKSSERAVLAAWLNCKHIHEHQSWTRKAELTKLATSGTARG